MEVNLAGLTWAFVGSAVSKSAKKYWRLSKDKGELVWDLKEAAEVIHQEEPR